MKPINVDVPELPDDDLLPEYDFDLSKAKPNRFASSGLRVVHLDPDIAAVFTSGVQVNSALRALIAAMEAVKQAS